MAFLESVVPRLFLGFRIFIARRIADRNLRLSVRDLNVEFLHEFPLVSHIFVRGCRLFYFDIIYILWPRNKLLHINSKVMFFWLTPLIYMGFFEVKYHGGGGSIWPPPMIFSERLIILPKYLAHLCISSEGIKILNFFFCICRHFLCDVIKMADLGLKSPFRLKSDNFSYRRYFFILFSLKCQYNTVL